LSSVRKKKEEEKKIKEELDEKSRLRDIESKIAL
jgi:hypothetical protein